MNYCSEKLEQYNIPSDWKKQLDHIIETLKKHNLLHNDSQQRNFVQHNETIYMIDFGWTSSKPLYPFFNVTQHELKTNEDMISLLDAVLKRTSKDRIEFYNSMQ